MLKQPRVVRLDSNLLVGVAIAVVVLGAAFFVLGWSSRADDLERAPSGEAAGISASSKSADLTKSVRTHNAGETQGDIPPGMVLIPGGTATLGVTEKAMLELAKRENYDFLRHLIAMYPSHSPLDKVEDLLVDVFEVTNLQYKTYLDANGLKASGDLLDLRWHDWVSGKLVPGLPPKYEDRPIGAVSWK